MIIAILSFNLTFVSQIAIVPSLLPLKSPPSFERVWSANTAPLWASTYAVALLLFHIRSYPLNVPVIILFSHNPIQSTEDIGQVLESHNPFYGLIDP